LGLLFVAPS
jgi:hypothetical protein